LMSIMQEPDRLVILTQMDASLTFLSIKSNDFSTGFGGFFTNFSQKFKLKHSKSRNLQTFQVSQIYLFNCFIFHWKKRWFSLTLLLHNVHTTCAVTNRPSFVEFLDNFA